MNLPDNVEFIINSLKEAGFEGFAVGGCVRDTLMGKTPVDWDICTSALPQEVKQVFKTGHIVETGLKHGTVTLVLNHIPYEITTYRTEGEYKDFRRPETVTFVKDISEDLSRRDFTVNAMAYNPEKGVVDLFEGTDDLEKRVIRCVGDPEKRFTEDALRILRGLRFASVLGFEIEEKTAFAIRKLKSLLKNISPERINVEFTKLLSGINRKKILIDFEEVFAEILPFPFEENWKTAVERAVVSKEVKICKSVLFHFLYKDHEKVRKALRSLKSDNAITDFCTDFSRFFDLPVPHTLTDVRKIVRLAGYEIYYEIIAFKGDIKTLEMLDEIKEKKLCCFVSELAVKGNDLMTLGFEGKNIGKAMSLLLEEVISEKISNTKPQLLDYAKKLTEAGDLFE